MNQIQKKILLIFFIISHNFIRTMHEFVKTRFRKVPFEQTPLYQENIVPHEKIATHINLQETTPAIEKTEPKTKTTVSTSTSTKTNNFSQFGIQAESLKNENNRRNSSINLNMRPENTEKEHATSLPASIDISSAYIHPERMEAPLEKYIEKINAAFAKNFLFIQKILSKNFFKSFSIMYIFDQSKALIGYNKIKLNDISLENINWDTPFPSSIQKFTAGLHELKTTSNNTTYRPQFKDNKSMSKNMNDYVVELQTNPLFKNQSPIILQQYILAVLKESKSGQSGWLFGSYPILEPRDVLDYIPTKKEAWPTEVNKEGDYIGEPSACQKIYVMMQAIQEIPEQAIKIVSQEIQLSTYGQVRNAITNIPSQIATYVKSSAYAFAMAQLKQQVSPNIYNAINYIFESQDPVDTVKKIALHEILNRDRNTTQGKPFFDPQDLETLQEIIEKETSHFITTTGPLITQALREQQTSLSGQQKTLLSKEAQIIFDDITSAALEKGAEILMNKLFTQDEIMQIENDAQIKKFEMQKEKSLQSSEDMIKNYLELKNKQNENSLNTGSFNRSTRSPVTLYFIDTFKASAKKIRDFKDNLKDFMSSVITTFSKLQGLTAKEEAMLQDMAAQETDSLLKNKDSWMNVKISEFDQKFSAWMDNFIHTIYKSLGKINPKYKQSMNFGAPENPLTPKITVIVNEAETDPTKKVTSILVNYKDVVMKFDPKNNNIIFDKNTGTYIIATELYTKSTTSSIIGSLSNAISDTLIKAVLINPLTQSSQGNLLAQMEVNALNDIVTSQGQDKEGILTIHYDPTDKTLTTIVAKKNNNGQISNVMKKYSTENQKLISQEIIVTPKSSENILGSGDTYSPDIMIKDYSPEIINPNKADLSIKTEYRHPQTGELFIFNAKPEDISVDESGTYKITGTLQATQEMQPLPDGVEGQIVKIMQKILPPLNVKTYRGLVSGFKNTWSGARIAQQYPELYRAAEKWMLDNYEVGVESIEIEYNPTHNILATKILSTMAVGQAQGKKSYYPLN